jgi:hypothetical protein
MVSLDALEKAEGGQGASCVERRLHDCERGSCLHDLPKGHRTVQIFGRAQKDRQNGAM